MARQPPPRPPLRWPAARALFACATSSPAPTPVKERGGPQRGERARWVRRGESARGFDALASPALWLPPPAAASSPCAPCCRAASPAAPAPRAPRSRPCTCRRCHTRRRQQARRRCSAAGEPPSR
eukprot:6832491-Prymnesium_polylepis.1